jgi:hypothetical protein
MTDELRVSEAMDEINRAVEAGASIREDEGGSPSAVDTPAPAPHVDMADILDRIKGIVYGDTPSLAPFETLQSFWEVRRACESVMAAARSLKSAADEAIAEDLGPNATRLDDSFLYAGPKKTMVVYNAEGLFDYLGDEARECFRPDDVRISSLRAVIERRVRRDMEAQAAEVEGASVSDKAVKQHIAAVVNAFCDWEEGDPQLHVVPITRAPKYAAQLVHGEIKERKPRP